MAYRAMLGRPDMSAAEINEIRRELQNFLRQFLDEHFRKEFEPDVLQKETRHRAGSFLDLYCG